MALSLNSDEIVDAESQEILTNYYDRSHNYSNLFDNPEMASFRKYVPYECHYLLFLSLYNINI